MMLALIIVLILLVIAFVAYKATANEPARCAPIADGTGYHIIMKQNHVWMCYSQDGINCTVFPNYGQCNEVYVKGLVGAKFVPLKK